MLSTTDLIFIVCVIVLLLVLVRTCVLCLHEMDEARADETEYFGNPEEAEAHFCTIDSCQDPYCVHARWRVTDGFARVHSPSVPEYHQIPL